MSEYFFNELAIPYFVSFFVSLVLTGLLILKKGKDRHVQLYIVVQSSITVLSLAAAMATSSLEKDTWHKWDIIIQPLAILAVTTVYHFSYVSLTGQQVIENRRIGLIYILPIFYTAWAIANPESTIEQFPDTELGLYGRDYTGALFWYWPVVRSILGVMLILTTINFIWMYRRSDELTVRRKALYFSLSTFIPLLTFAISLLLVAFDVFLKVQLGIASFTLTGAIMTYGIVKYQLFDIEIIVKKTFVYSLIILPLIGLFRLIELGVSYFVSFTFFGGDLMARLIAAAIVAGCFFPLRHVIIPIGDKLLPELTRAVKYEPDELPDAQRAIYRRQLEHVLEDGKISEKEHKMLQALREDLGISEEVHGELEQEILGSRKEE